MLVSANIVIYFILTIMPTTSYADRISENINKYIQLVTDNPKVRHNEFEILVNYAALKHSKIILEAPAEGKTLETFFPESIIHRADFVKITVPGYADECAVTSWGLSNIKSNFYDAVLSLAPIHHANELQKQDYISGAYLALKAGGVFAFGEVEYQSKLHFFLDCFINAYSHTGHVGQYPDAKLCDFFEYQGFEHVTTEIYLCQWRFDSAHSLHHYLTALFALQPLTVSFVMGSVEHYLGITEKNGELCINWPLRFYRGVKPFPSI